MLGIADGFMKVLGQGQRHKPAAALEIGIVDELVTVPGGDARQGPRVDRGPARQGAAQARSPGTPPGTRSPAARRRRPKLAAMLPAFPANLRKQLKGAPMPAPRNILAAAVEGTQVDVDTALRIETRYFVELVTGQVAKNMTKAFFFDLQAINGGASRPAGYERWHAAQGRRARRRDDGRGHRVRVRAGGLGGRAQGRLAWRPPRRARPTPRGWSRRACKRGQTTPEKGEALLERITPTADYDDLAGCDLVIEAVFESVALKQEVFREAAKVDRSRTRCCARTPRRCRSRSSPTGVDRPGDFVGLHFFSPVDKMPLIEIIRGERTSDATLARAFDVARRACSKTPIVVNDSRGFFTSRVISTFLNEGVAMLAEGIDPQTIEQASSQAGYPAPVLQLMDELTLTLPQQDPRRGPGRGRRRLRPAPRRGRARPAGGGVRPHGPQLGGAGFYEYDERQPHAAVARAAHASSGATNHDVDLHELAERMLFVEAVETQQCLDEGVLTCVADANVGSMLGIGFPPWTGGVVQYVEGFPGGVAGFVARADALADAVRRAVPGSRFAAGPRRRLIRSPSAATLIRCGSPRDCRAGR